MSHNERESLSALMDNEANELELRRVLKILEASPDAADTWRRYHLARSLMQRDREVDVSMDLSAGIMARIESEPLPLVEEASGKRRSFSFASSAAIAAAVSLMVITGVQVYNVAGTPGADGPAMAGSGSAASTGGDVASASSSPVSRPSLVDLPMFQQSPGGNTGMMPVGAVGATSDMPMFMAPNTRQSQRGDLEQARLLQSYLDRHAEGSAYRSGDGWMPLLRASGHETLGQR
ncbi:MULTISPECIES: sigma-E factor negative regulatory protein [Halomonadaceae]|uniref:sigma-E factor negative regulatory protein n=1 Tax=Halomonadaceae TaxID=28256 RepID=UPI00159B53FA|nr:MULTISPECIES: sigma-E factor negative regulatory protein [Halomonas]QJQ94727.1 sigma-E factor negative regulatory protein [Halomonas sp. PA5]